MKPLISRYCAVPGCFSPPFDDAFCRIHGIFNRLGVLLVTLSTFLALLIAAMALHGCAGRGPSKDRLRVLLHECREANRQRVRIIKEYESADCKRHPEQDFGTINFGEAGQ